MAIKNYLTQAGKNGSQNAYKNGGQDDIITATDDELSGFGYIISGGGGDDSIFGSEFDRLVEVEDPTDPTMTIMVVGGDVLIGGTGGDFIEGGGGDDTIFGGKENERRRHRR
jgi:serralysin